MREREIMINTIEIQRNTKTDSPNSLVKNINDIIGFKPANESIVIFTTKMSDNSIIKCTIISALETYKIADLVDSSDENIGIILCYFTNQVINKIEEEAIDLFYHLGGYTQVRDFLYIRDNRWGSFICYDKNCCPPRGRIIE